MMVKTLLANPENLDKSQMNLELALTARLRQQFPQLSDDVMMRLIPCMGANVDDFNELSTL